MVKVQMLGSGLLGLEVISFRCGEARRLDAV
jgi:hypothetical protein